MSSNNKSSNQTSKARVATKDHHENSWEVSTTTSMTTARANNLTNTTMNNNQEPQQQHQHSQYLTFGRLFESLCSLIARLRDGDQEAINCCQTIFPEFNGLTSDQMANLLERLTLLQAQGLAPLNDEHQQQQNAQPPTLGRLVDSLRSLTERLRNGDQEAINCFQTIFPEFNDLTSDQMASQLGCTSLQAQGLAPQNDENQQQQNVQPPTPTSLIDALCCCRLFVKPFRGGDQSAIAHEQTDQPQQQAPQPQNPPNHPTPASISAHPASVSSLSSPAGGPVSI